MYMRKNCEEEVWPWGRGSEEEAWLWGRSTADEEEFFTTSKGPTLPVRILLMRKKQCLKIKTFPGCGTWIWCKWAWALDHNISCRHHPQVLYCQVNQQGGDWLVPPNYSSYYLYGSDEMHIMQTSLLNFSFCMSEIEVPWKRSWQVRRWLIVMAVQKNELFQRILQGIVQLVSI